MESSTVDTIPPSIRAVSTQNYVNVGGSGLVVYQTSSDATRSGLFVGDIFFKKRFESLETGLHGLCRGEEEGKGNDLTREVHDLLLKADTNYVGYVEGRDLNSGNVDVMVCDGFVGNIVLKSSEGIVNFLKSYPGNIPGGLASRLAGIDSTFEGKG